MPGGSRQPAEQLVAGRRPPPVHREVGRGSPSWHTSSPLRPLGPVIGPRTPGTAARRGADGATTEARPAARAPWARSGGPVDEHVDSVVEGFVFVEAQVLLRGCLG